MIEAIRRCEVDDDPSRERVDERSVVELYRTERERLRRLAFMLTGSAEAAEDVVQDVFLRYGRRRSAADNPRAYLRASVVNACSTRRRRRRDVPVARQELGDTLEPHQIDLWDAVQRLPERRRAAVVLRYYCDLSTDDIAALLRCRPGTVSSLLHRAVRDLRKALS